MKHRLLFFAIIFMVQAAVVQAQNTNGTISATAPSGQTLYYNIVGSNELMVSNIDCPFDFENSIIEPVHLVIPSQVEQNGVTYTVTRIGSDAFSPCMEMASVVIPNTVTYIGDGAFSNCIELTSVTMSNAVDSIGNSAFAGCQKLTSIALPNGLTYLGEGVFNDCWSLVDVGLGTSLTRIRERTFYGCMALRSIIIPNTVTYIGREAFRNCPLDSIWLGDNVDSIDYYAFSNNVGITKYLRVPASLSWLGWGVFEGRSCDEIHLDGSIADWCNTYFSSEYSVPFGHLYINAELQTNLTIPDGVTEIKSRAFYGFGFYLTNISIPSTVTTIGGNAFQFVRHIEYHGTATGAPWGALSMNGTVDGDFIFSDSAKTNLVSYIGHGSDVVVPSSTVTIADYAFYDCTNIRTLTIPNSVTSIGAAAFSQCDSLRTVIIPNSVTSIGISAFSGCNSLLSVTLPSGITTIANSILIDCSSLKRVTIPESVTTIGYAAFGNCHNLDSVFVMPSVPPSLENDSYGYPNNYGGHNPSFYIPCVNLAAYQNHADWQQWVPYMHGVPERDFSYHIASNNVNYGTVEIGELDCDSNITVMASPNWGYRLTRWSDGDTAATRTMHFDRDTTLTAIFDSIIELTVGDFIFSDSARTHLKEYIGSGGDVVIPSSVTIIEDSAFFEHSAVTSVIIPSSVTGIGRDAFTKLRNAHLHFQGITPPHLTNYLVSYWGNVSVHVSCEALDAYENSDNWRTYFLEASNTPALITTDIIYNITSQQYRSDVVVGNVDCDSNLTVTAVPPDGYLFSHWTDGDTTNPRTIHLTHDTVLNAFYKELADGDFVYGDSARTQLKRYIGNGGDVVLPSTTVYILRNAFANCSTVTSVTMPNSVREIYSDAFYNCTGLTTVTLSDSLQTIWENAFNACSSLTSVNIPNSVYEIRRGAFAHCYSLTTLTLPQGLTFIADNAFYNDTSLAAVTIPDGVVSIGASAFSGCRSLQTLHIPSAVSSIQGSFRGCSGLTSITVDDANQTFDSRDGCNAIISTATNELIQGCQSTVIPNTVTSIGELAFAEMDGLTSINLPNSLTVIRGHAFYNSGLTSVTLPGSITELGMSAFGSCYSLTSATIGEGITYLTGFDWDTSLTSITIPSSVTTIGENAFYVCSSLTDITLGDSVKHIGMSAFTHCTSLTSIQLPEGLLGIGTWAFAECNSLASIDLPESLNYIGDEAFYNCSGLTSLTIPDNVTSLGYGGIADLCHSLRKVTIGSGVSSLPDNAFFRSTGLDTIVMRSTTPPTIGENAFSTTTGYPSYEDYSYIDDSTVIYVPCEALDAYLAHPDWSGYASVIRGNANVDFHYSFASNNPDFGTLQVGDLDCDSNVTATAIPSSRFYEFISWGSYGNENPSTFHLTGNAAIIAYFDTARYYLSFVPSDTNKGRVTGTLYGDVFSSNPSWTYDTVYLEAFYGDTLFLEAVAFEGCHFVQWSDGDTNITRAITVTQDTMLTAIFEPNSYTLTLHSNAEGRGTVSGGGTYTHASQATAFAMPAPGYQFSHWSDGFCGTSRTILMTSDTALTAFFYAVPIMEVTACDNYEWNGMTYTDSGTYTHTTVNAAGCDSSATLRLILNYGSRSSETATACDNYEWYGRTYTQSGEYTYIDSNAAGCPSVTTMHLTIYYSNSSSETVTACDSYTWNGQTYTESGDHTYHSYNVFGCDSVALLHLTINHGSSSICDSVTACGSYVWNGNVYDQSGVYIYNTFNTFGCDSTVAIPLTIKPSYHIEESVVATDSYEWRGSVYTSGGVYSIPFVTIDGCDSIETLYLSMSNTQNEMCLGWNNPVNFSLTGGTNQTQWSGFTGSRLNGVSSCQYESSVYTATVPASELGTIYSTSYCDMGQGANSNSYDINGRLDYNRKFAIKGSGFDPATGGALSYLPPDTSISSSIRIGNYCGGGESEKLSFTTNLTSSNAIFTLWYAMSLNDERHEASANPELKVVVEAQYPHNGDWRRIDGDTLCYFMQTPDTNADNIMPFVSGASDSNQSSNLYLPWQKLTLDLSRYLYNRVRISISMSDGTQNGQYAYCYIAGNCHRLALTSECSESSGNITVSAVDGAESYRWYRSRSGVLWGYEEMSNENNYELIGETTTPSIELTPEHFVNSYGHTMATNTVMCKVTTRFNPSLPNTTVMYANVERPTNSDIYETTCHDYQWNDNTYTESGDYVWVSDRGCDTTTLHLTFLNDLPVDTAYVNATACDSYEWNGQTYTESGQYTITTTNSIGCDSVITLNLSINYSSSSEDVTACDSYTWNGQTYTESGDYTYNTINAYGCDSVALLHLTINDSYFYEYTASAIDSFYWKGNVFNTEDTYVLSYIASNGCDSTEQLHLKLYHHDSVATVPYSCNFEEDGTNGWLLVNGEQPNYWTVGDSASNGSGRSLYITNDGGSNIYDTAASSTVFALRKLYIDTPGDYDFSFDWMAQGETVDYMRAVLVPDNVEIVAGNYNGFPAGGMAMDGRHLLNLSSLWQSREGTVHVGEAGVYNIVFMWYNNANLGCQPPAAIDNIVFKHNSCPMVSGVRAWSSSSTIVLSWDAGGSEWEVTCGDTTVLVSTPSHTFTGLSANTNYVYSIRAICGLDDTSMRYTGVVRTDCGVISALPWSDGFEDVVNNDLRPMPYCWGRYRSANTSPINYPYSASNSSYAHSGSAHSGSRSLDFYCVSTSEFYPDTMVAILPELDVATYPMGDNRITLWARLDSSTYDKMIYVGTVSNPADMGTFTLVDTVLVSGTDFRKYIVPLTGASDPYVALMVLKGDNNIHLYIDDLTLEQQLACPNVRGLTLDSIIASSVTVSWRSNGACNFEVELRQDDVVLQRFAVVGTTVTFDGLQLDNDYQVYVRTVCDTIHGEWSTPLEVHIGYCVPNPTSRDAQGLTVVAFGGMVNDSLHPQVAPFYGNYSAMQGSVAAGTTARVDITYQTGYTYGTVIWVDWDRNISFDDYEIVYRGESAVNKPTTLAASFHIPAGQDTGLYRMRIAGADSYFDSYINNDGAPSPCFASTYAVAEDYTILVTEAVSCPDIASVAVDEVSSNSVALSWEDDYPGSRSYAITVYPIDETTPTFQLATDQRAIIVTGLLSNTSYTFGVQVFCPDGDSTAVVLSPIVRTECEVISALPWSDGFEDVPDGSYQMPYCWQRYQSAKTVTNDYPYAYSYNSYSGSSSLYFNGSITASYPDTMVAILPELDVAAYPMGDNRITLWARMANNTYNKILYVGTVSDPANMGTFTLVDSVLVSGSDYLKYNIPLTGATDPYVALMVLKGNGSMYIDDLTLEQQPACPDIRSLSLDSHTASSATVNWRNNGSDSYTVELRQNGVILQSFIVADTIATFDDLLLDNDYQVYVRTVCDTILGEWSEPLDIHIGYCVPNPTSRDAQGIVAVAFGGMVNDSLHPQAAPYYGNYSAMQGVVAAGATARVDITYHTGFTYGTVIWVDWDRNFSFDDYEIVYSGEAAKDKPTTLAASFHVPASQDTGLYRMRIAGADSYFDSYINNDGTPSPCFTSTYSVAEDYTILVTEAVSCPDIASVAVDEVSSNSVALSWEDDYPGSRSYAITVYPIDETTPAFQLTTDQRAITVTGLLSNTSYTFGVQAFCPDGDSTAIVSSPIVRTECDVISVLPWNDSFEYVPDGDYQMPYCWQRYQSAKTVTYDYPYANSSYAYSGSRSLCFSSSTSASYPDTMVAILPALDVAAYPMGDNRITFWARMTNNTYNKILYVGTVSDPADMNTFTLVDSVLVSGSDYLKYNIALTGATDPYVALMVLKGNGAMYIDDLTLEQQPACPDVTSLYVGDTSSSEINLFWVDTLNSGVTYTLIDMATMDTVATGIDAQYYTVTGLTPNTHYTFGVRVDCSSDESSPIYAIDCRTACGPEGFPFVESFDANLSGNPCWAGATGITAEQVFGGEWLPLTTLASQWTYSNTVSNGLEVGHYRANIYGASCKRWLVTPNIDLTNAPSAQLSFDAAFTVYTTGSDAPATGFEGNSSQAFMVLVSTDGGETWPEANAIKWQNENGDHTLVELASSSYIRQFVDLQQYLGQVIRIAFYAQSTTNGGDNNIHIDNIAVAEMPECGDVDTTVEAVTACNSYTWNINVYNQSGVYYHITRTHEGCDSMLVLHLTINQPVAATVSATACDTYEWNGETYTQSGEYTYNTTGSNGCDSTVTLTLTVNHAVAATLSATACDSYEWNGETYTATGDYTFSHTDTNGCAQVDTLNLIVNYSSTSTEVATACDSYIWNGETYTQSGDYTFTTTGSNGCDSTVTLTLTVNQPVAATLSATACDSYEWNGETYTQSGEYTYTATGVNGCDSTVTLLLTINNPVGQFEFQQACDSYEWNGETYTATGDYTFSHTDTNGCTQVDTLYLVINHSNSSSESATACDSYEWNGETYTQSGNYTFTTTGSNGCDSTVTLALTINQAVAATVSATACDSYTWNGETYTATGYYTFSHADANGCTQVDTLYLIVNHSVQNSIIETVCSIYEWNGEIYDTTGNYTFTTTGSNGCDSTVTLTLTINQPVAATVSATACDSYEWNGETYTQSGEYTYTTTGSNGCDSTVTLLLTINNPVGQFEFQQACDSYEWNGETYTATGDYTFSHTDTKGCTQVDTLYLVINHSNSSSEYATACDSYTWNGETYTQSGEYTYTTTNVMGCDSTVTLTLTVNQPVAATVSATACDSYEWNGETYTATGDYTFSHTDTNGCTQVDTLYLVINHSNSSSEYATACDSYTWNGETYTQSGNYTFTTTGSNDCDSTVTLTLTINQPVAAFVSAIACDNYEWNGETYTATGDYTFSHTDTNGCTQVDTLYLVINHSNSSSEYATACDSYTWNGETYTQSGEYTYTTTNAMGCDSTVTLTLTINQPVAAFVSAIACDNYEWNGETYTATGDYTFIHADTNGCTQIDTLNLTVNHSVQSNIVETVCGIYEWNGEVYDATGIYTYTTTGSNGCDSTVALTLTVNQPVTTIETATACDSYDWNGETYSQSGEYTFTTTGGNGCDSTITLLLTINNPVGLFESLQVCDSYTWNGETYTATGEYTFSHTDTNGCTQVDTLHLTVNQSVQSNIVETVCGIYEWNGVVYDSTGSYTYTTIGSNGCDSTVALTLTVNQPVTTIETATACDSYDWNGETYSQSGEYTFTTTGGNGCDSTITLLLTINNPVGLFESLQVCDSYTWNGETYTATGEYTFSHTDTNGCTQVDTLHLTVNQSVQSNIVETVCGIYEWNGEVYDSTGIYTYTTIGSNGCDSTVTLTLTVNQPVASTETAIACDSYDWNGETYTQSGEYTYTTTGSNGCDSTVTLTLTVNQPVTTIETATVCDSYDWNGVTYTQNGEYTFTTAGSNGCDSTVTLTLTVNHSNSSSESATACDSYTWNGETYTQSGEYTFTTTNALGCDSTATLYLTVNASGETYEDVVSCDSYTWNGTTYTTSGTYQYSTTGDNGCQVTAILNLTVNTSSNSAETATACDSYSWNGETYTATGDYTFIHTNTNGCTQVDTLHLTVNQSVQSNIVETVCGIYEWNGVVYDSTGSYTYTTIGSNGCDSTVALTLTVNQPVTTIETATACDSYDWNGETYSQSGEYTFTTTGGNGCDSTITLLLTINNPVGLFESLQVCDSYTWNGETYTATGDYTFSHTDTNGCTQVDTLHLTVNHSVQSNIVETVCGIYEWNGVVYDSTGNYTYTTIGSNGCDSTVTLTLTVNQPVTTIETATACDSYTWNGETYTQSGEYTFTTTNALGCDSTATLYLTVNASGETYEDVVSCDSYTWNGTTYTTSGTYQYSTTGDNGCQVTAILNLTVNTSSNSAETATACDSYSWNGETYTATGDYTFSHTDTNGCTQVDTLHLTVNHSVQSNIVETVCGIYEWNGVVYDSTGNYTYTTTGGNGCDSTVTLTLTVNQPVTTIETATVCDSYDWNGETYNQSGEYTFTTTGGNGCDSTITLLLTINNPVGLFESLQVCDSYTWNGETYTATGEYTFSHTDTNGCTQVDTLHLTVNQSVQSNIVETVCGIYEWNGVVYDSTGSYTYTTIGSNGCDSTVTLTLTVNQPVTTIETATACDSYTWNGETYTQSGEYTFTTTNASGCDSTVTLYLTVNTSGETSEDVVSCDSYTWNGTTYTTSGTYQYTTIGDNGCQITATLNLTVNTSSNTIETVTACDSYTWNGETYTATGDYTFSHTDTNGCTQVDTLHLTVNQSVQSNIVETVCGIYEWNGEVYDSTGIYTYTTTGSNGCDSTATLTLTVNHPVTTIETATACDSYDWNGETYIQSGEYTFTTAGSNGCDSTVTLTLTVNHSSTSSETATACDSYTWNGETYTQSGEYTFIATGSNGCDSTVTLNLTVIHSSTSSETATACDSYTWNGETYTQSGEYTFITTGTNGCDSTVTMTLTVNQSVTSTETATACDSFTWNGETYTQSGVYTFTTIGSNGCDSTVSLYLTINNCSTTIVTACDSYSWQGHTITSSGIYVIETDTLLLTVNHSRRGDTIVNACGSYTWIDGQTYSSSQNAQFTLTDVNGCDSTVTLHLNIKQCSVTEITACDSYTWHGDTYYSSGVFADGNDTLILTVNRSSTGDTFALTYGSFNWYEHTGLNSTQSVSHTFTGLNGCDSIVSLHLLVDATPGKNTSHDTAVACDIYYWFGFPVTSSGTYVLGTDTLTLTILHGSRGDTVASACGSFTWINGETYTSSQSPQFAISNSQGCDSVVTLHLTVNSCSSVEVNACETYSWHGYMLGSSGTYYDGFDTLVLTVNHNSFGDTFAITCGSLTWIDGHTYYTSTQSPQYVLPNSQGCDSTVTLHLTIINCSSSEVTACDSFMWRGNLLTNSGTYYDGFDTLTLTINHNTSGDTAVTACDNFTWIDGQTYTSTQDALCVMTNSQGCDSIVTLHLTVRNSSYRIDDIEACDSYEWNGETYTQSGEYTITTTNAVGCDSTSILNLTVNHSNSGSETVTACDSYTWNGETLAQSGEYTYSTTNAAGCDSTATLVLTLNHSITIYDTVELYRSDMPFDYYGTSIRYAGDYDFYESTVQGCDSIVHLHVTILLGIDDVSAPEMVTVYPNPTTGILTINAENVERVDVLDLVGRTVASFTRSNKIDISQLAAGSYTLRIKTASGNIIRKVVKR